MIEAAKRLDHVSTYYFAKKLKEINQLNSAGKDVINLGIGSPDLKPPAVVSQALIDGLEANDAHSYQSYTGIPELKNAFASFYLNKFQLKLNPENEILPLIGSKEGIMHIAMSFINPGDEVLIPNPGYPAYRMTTLLAGGTVTSYDLREENNWLIDIEELEKRDLSKVKLMWINYPHMPTGARADDNHFREICSFAERQKILICNDNPYAFILNDHPKSILSFCNDKSHVLELNSLSKCFNMSGWRVGALLGHADLIQKVLKFKSNMDSGMFKPIQLAAAKALQIDASWFDELNTVYADRKKIACQILNQLNCSFEQDSSGLFVWAKTPNGHGQDLSDKILEEAKVFITPGFIFGTQGKEYLRISLCANTALLQKALERIKNIKW